MRFEASCSVGSNVLLKTLNVWQFNIRNQQKHVPFNIIVNESIKGMERSNYKGFKRKINVGYNREAMANGKFSGLKTLVNWLLKTTTDCG